jgi:hypothetical protein
MPRWLSLPRRAAVVALALSALHACKSSTEDEAPLEPLEIPAGCNPLVSEVDCLLPFPFDGFAIDDDATPSGRRIEYTDAAVLRDKDGGVVDFLGVHPTDGFSIVTPILAVLPGGPIDPSTLPSIDDPASSLLDDSSTILLEAETGRRILHFAELDPRTDDDDRRALTLRVLEPLQPDTRYVVALRGLQLVDGAAVATPEGFRRLRDAQTDADPSLDALAPRFDDEVFGALENHGVARDELQLAWDFTTRTTQTATADMLAIRDDVIAKLAVSGAEATITSVMEDPDPAAPIALRVRGELTVPLYLEQDVPTGRIARDGAGRPEANGTTTAEFLMIVPRSVFEDDVPARFVQFGHGFFGTKSEIVGSYVARFADETSSVVVAIDWIGMSEADLLYVAGDLQNDIGATYRFADRVHQAVANQIALAWAMKREFAELPELQRPGGGAYVDPDRVYFYGISMGHILGGIYTALAPDIDRAMLQVGGGAFTAIMFRSRNFGQFLDVLTVGIPDPLEQQKFAALSQTSLDPIDPVNYAQWLREYDGVEREILMHVGLGDTSVPSIATHIHARAAQLPLLTPTPRELDGFTTAGYPAPSGLVEFDLGVPAPLPEATAQAAADDTGVHVGQRELAAAIEQIDLFLRPGGAVEQTCDGACDPE